MKFFIHNLQKIRCLSSLFQEKHKMKKLLRNLLFPTLLTSTFCVYAPTIVAFPVILNSAFGETNEGVIDLRNYVKDAEGNNNYVQTKHFSEALAPGISEGKDRWDGIGPGYMPNNSGSYSEVNDVGTLWKFWTDARPENSNTPFNVKLIYNGKINEAKQNWLKFNFRYIDYRFGNRPIIFQQTNSTDPNAFYPVYDVRRAIAQNEGVVPLEDLDAGRYGPGTITSDVTPYGSGILTIGTRLLSDLNDDGKVGLDDFAYFAADWNATDVNSVADISGLNGIPDKNVDSYDLGAFADDYLQDINDPNTWSRVR